MQIQPEMTTIVSSVEREFLTTFFLLDLAQDLAGWISVRGVTEKVETVDSVQPV